MTSRKVVKQALEGPLKGILGYSEDQESPVTSTVMPTALPVALLLVTALESSFLGVALVLGITTKVDAVDGGGPHGLLHDLQGVRSPGPPTPARTPEEERPLLLRSSWDTANTWVYFPAVSIPEPRRKGGPQRILVS